MRIPCCAHNIEIEILIVHVPWGVPSWLLEHSVDLIIIFSYVQLVFSDPLIGYFFCRSIFQFDFFLQSLDPQYSLISTQLFVIGYVHLISLILWEMHTLWGSSYYIGLLNFSSHFGNRCQWGRSLEGLMKFGFML